MALYKIVRHFYRSNRKVTIYTNLTLEEAQEHCRNPETSSRTCSLPVNVRRTRKYGPWFDGFTEM